MATCDPQALARDSSCFFCLPPGYYYPIKLAILARWLKSLNPAADTSVAGLLATASCFACPPQGELLPLKLALLCDIGGGGGSGGTPAAPLTLTISGASAQANVVLNWTQGTAPDMNEIWVSTDFGVTYNLRATVSGSSTSYSDVTGMGGADFWVYKVRAKASGLFSSFSPLAAISSGKSFANDTNLNGYQFFPVLYVCLSGFNISTSITPTVINLAVLAKIGGSLNAGNCPNLTSLSAPVLVSIGGSFDVSGSGLTSLSLPSLATVSSDFIFDNTFSMGAVSLAALASIGGSLSFISSTATSLSAPLLTSITNDLHGDTSGLTLLSLALTTLGGVFVMQGSTALTTISLPQLANAIGAATVVDCSGCTALSSVSWPNVKFTNGMTITFFGDALSAASVNLILARGVASPTLGDDYELQGGTNAAPTGQGITDKMTLQTAGNTVNTN